MVYPLIVWVVVTTLSFALTVMGVRERVLSIAGILLMFVNTALSGNDGSIGIAYGWDTNNNAVQQTIAAQPSFVIIGLALIACEVAILFTLNDAYAKAEESDEGLLDEGFLD